MCVCVDLMARLTMAIVSQPAMCIQVLFLSYYCLSYIVNNHIYIHLGNPNLGLWGPKPLDSAFILNGPKFRSSN